MGSSGPPLLVEVVQGLCSVLQIYAENLSSGDSLELGKSESLPNRRNRRGKVQ
jgi:hypothetical protein